MDKEMRLKRLSAQIGKMRSQARVGKWSEDIKRETIFLAKAFGVQKVSKVTQIHVSRVYAWISDHEQNSEIDRRLLESKIQVTRFSPIQIQNPKQAEEEKALICSLIKGKIKFQIFSKDLAEKIAERFFQ